MSNRDHTSEPIDPFLKPNVVFASLRYFVSNSNLGESSTIHQRFRFHSAQKFLHNIRNFSFPRLSGLEPFYNIQINFTGCKESSARRIMIVRPLKVNV